MWKFREFIHRQHLINNRPVCVKLLCDVNCFIMKIQKTTEKSVSDFGVMTTPRSLPKILSNQFLVWKLFCKNPLQRIEQFYQTIMCQGDWISQTFWIVQDGRKLPFFLVNIWWKITRVLNSHLPNECERDAWKWLPVVLALNTEKTMFKFNLWCLPLVKIRQKKYFLKRFFNWQACR